MPTQKDVWDQQVWMAKLGPKYTGNKAHTTFVEFLADESQEGSAATSARDRYTLPRWDATRSDDRGRAGVRRRVQGAGDVLFPVLGTDVGGRRHRRARLCGEQSDVHARRPRREDRPDRLRDEHARVGARMYQPWGINPPGESAAGVDAPGARRRSAISRSSRRPAPSAVILGWTDVSDANAADQYTPFSRPPQGIPGLYVGRDTRREARGRSPAPARKATVVLEADIVAGHADRHADRDAARRIVRRSHHRQHAHRRPERDRGKRRASGSWRSPSTSRRCRRASAGARWCSR